MDQLKRTIKRNVNQLASDTLSSLICIAIVIWMIVPHRRRALTLA